MASPPVQVAATDTAVAAQDLRDYVGDMFPENAAPPFQVSRLSTINTQLIYYSQLTYNLHLLLTIFNSPFGIPNTYSHTGGGPWDNTRGEPNVCCRVQISGRPPITERINTQAYRKNPS